MKQSLLISICIPTYQRPDLLEQAIESCLNQTYSQIQILVSDDSQDGATENLVSEKYKDIPIKYRHNSPPLGQAKNVNQLFDMADGDRLVLLHDDDMLLPNALQIMDQAWRNNPGLTVCYGKQVFVNAEGKLLEDLTTDSNIHYYRTADRAGRQPSELFAALTQQMPNDGFMVLTTAARTVRMNEGQEIGSICDQEFSIRMAAHHKGFFLIDNSTALYRLNSSSVTSKGLDVHFTFKLLEELKLPNELDCIRNDKLRQLAPVAVTRWLSAGDNRSARRVYFSHYYPPTQRASLKGIAQLVLLIVPPFILKRLL